MLMEKTLYEPTKIPTNEMKFCDICVDRREREKGEVVLRYTLVLSRTHFNERREFCNKQLETFFPELNQN